MFGSEALEVAIGLVLLFLLISLFLTAAVEMIESVLKTRAADLQRALTQMLSDENSAQEAAKKFYGHPLIAALLNGNYEASKQSYFFRREKGGALPSYIPRDLFATVALDLEQSGEGIRKLSAVLESYRRLYGDDLSQLQARLESWYDGVMDRAAGWYKRRTQKLLFWLGLALACALNINPILVAQQLAASPTERAAMVQIAERTLKKQGEEDELKRLHGAVAQVGLPIGWSSSTVTRSFPLKESFPSWGWLNAIFLAVAGWLITALAATLGAPFWFDLLNKIMVVRSTVKPKEKSRDEASEDRTIERQRSNVAVANGAPAGAPAAPRSAQHDLDDGAVG